MAQVGRNVEVEVNAHLLTITVNLKAPGKPSATGKTLVIASTEGNQAIAPGVYLGLNVYTKPA